MAKTTVAAIVWPLTRNFRGATSAEPPIQRGDRGIANLRMGTDPTASAGAVKPVPFAEYCRRREDVPRCRA